MDYWARWQLDYNHHLVGALRSMPLVLLGEREKRFWKSHISQILYLLKSLPVIRAEIETHVE